MLNLFHRILTIMQCCVISREIGKTKHSFLVHKSRSLGHSMHNLFLNYIPIFENCVDRIDPAAKKQASMSQSKITGQPMAP